MAGTKAENSASPLGADMLRALQGRGLDVSLEDARSLTLALIDLLRNDLLIPAASGQQPDQEGPGLTSSRLVQIH